MKVNYTYSSWEEKLLKYYKALYLAYFVEHLSKLCLNYFSSYVDDNTIFDSGKCIVDVISSLQETSEKLIQMFSNNQMKGKQINGI